MRGPIGTAGTAGSAPGGGAIAAARVTGGAAAGAGSDAVTGAAEGGAAAGSVPARRALEARLGATAATAAFGEAVGAAAVGGASLAVGAAALGGAVSLAVGGASLAASAARAALASTAAGGGAAASVPARRASALYWAWAPAAATCWVVLAWAAVSVTGGRVGMLARSGVVVAASACACWALSVGNWVSAGVVSSLSRPVGSRSAMVEQADRPEANPRPITRTATATGRVCLVMTFDFPTSFSSANAEASRLSARQPPALPIYRDPRPCASDQPLKSRE